MPRYRVNFYTDDDPGGHTFTADAFLIDDEALLFVDHTASDTSVVVGAVAAGMWQTAEKVADTPPALSVRASFDGIATGITPPPMVDTDSVRVTHLIDTPDDGDDQ